MGPQVVRALLALALLAAGQVAAQTTGETLVTWSWPDQNTDGTAYTDPNGGRVYWGPQPGNYPNQARVAMADAAGYRVTGLAPGTWFVQVSAINAANVESMLSNVASKTIENPNGPLITTGGPVYTLLVSRNALLVSQVGTVAAGKPCDQLQFINAWGERPIDAKTLYLVAVADVAPFPNVEIEAAWAECHR